MGKVDDYQVKQISWKYATPEAEIKKMAKKGMSSATIIKTLQTRWQKEAHNIVRLNVLLKYYAPESIYNDRDETRQVIGHILNARRNEEKDDLSDMMLAKLDKAKRIEAVLVATTRALIFLALAALCFVFLNMYWGFAVLALAVVYCVISIANPRAFFPRNPKAFSSVVERMHGKELEECKKRKAEDEKADVYMPVILKGCKLGRSYSF